MRAFFSVLPAHRQHPEAEIVLPRRATFASAGYDFFSPVAFSLAPGERIQLATDVKACMNAGEFLQLHVRSGLGLRGLRMLNTVGIVDGDYFSNESNDGNIIFGLRNDGNETLQVAAGDRVAQGIFLAHLLTDDDDVQTARKGGFGHTGR